MIWRLIEDTLGFKAGGQVFGRLRLEGILVQGKTIGRELRFEWLLWQTLHRVCALSTGLHVERIG